MLISKIAVELTVQQIKTLLVTCRVQRAQWLQLVENSPGSSVFGQRSVGQVNIDELDHLISILRNSIIRYSRVHRSLLDPLKPRGGIRAPTAPFR